MAVLNWKQGLLCDNFFYRSLIMFEIMRHRDAFNHRDLKLFT